MDDSPNVTDDAADEIMDRIVKSATQVPSQRVVPRERKRSRANRKSRKCLGVRMWDSACGTSPLVLYDPGRAGTQRWALVNCHWCPEGPPVPIDKRFRAGQSALAAGEEGCCSHLSSVFAISGQASPNSHFVPRKV